MVRAVPVMMISIPSAFSLCTVAVYRRRAYGSTRRRSPARLPSTSVGTAIRLKASFSPVSRGLVTTVAALALLLQAAFATPLALRMTADALQSLELGASICAATADGGPAANGHHPLHQLPVHNHAQCLICQAHALPLGLLAVVLCVLVAAFARVAIRCAAATGPPCRRDRYHSYHSRAPPVAA